MVLIGSVMAHFGYAGHTLYTTSKAALSGLLKALTVELGSHGIRVNMIVPGYILNDPPALYRNAIPPHLWRDFHERFAEDFTGANQPQQPLPFWGLPEDIAQAVSFLHSSAARYITGVELPVDGGLLCQTPIQRSSNDEWAWTPAMKEWLAERGL